MPPDQRESVRDDLARRVDDIEAAYELMLGYAAQGHVSDAGTSSGGELRASLARFDRALTGLAEAYRELLDVERRDPAAFDSFLGVLMADAHAAQAALRLVLAQERISSQLVDNLNASIHVRALLTDLFLIDELLKRGG
jgi:hypothetical protein